MTTSKIPGWTGHIQLQGSIDNGGWPALNKTTIAEGCSIWNRLFYPVDNPIGNHTGKLNVNMSGYSALNNQYPQLSHWYIPSIDELAFIAKSCVNEGLQQKIIDANGISIGDPRINRNDWSIGTVNPIGSNSVRLNTPAGLTQFTSNYVWSSSGSWADGVLSQYAQNQTTGSVTSGNSANNTTRQFTNAWAIRFDHRPDTQDPTFYKVSKFHDLDDRLELRLVRMVRCDQRYYDQNSDQQLKNTFWQVPRLTISTVVTGLLPTSNVSNIFQLNSNNSSGATYNLARWNQDPQTATIFKNTP